MRKTSNVKRATPKNEPTAATASGAPALPYVIRARAQVRALASPARQEIVDALVAAGPCPIAELAAHTGRAPDSLYFHINRLMKVGLVIERTPRATGKRPAAVYDVPGRPLVLGYASLSGAHDLPAVVSAALRLADRDFARAIKLGGATVEGPRRTLWGGRAKGWVGPDEIEEINRLIARVFEVVHSARPGQGRSPQSFTFVLAPVRPSRRAPRPRAAPNSPERNGEP